MTTDETVHVTTRTGITTMTLGQALDRYATGDPRYDDGETATAILHDLDVTGSHTLGLGDTQVAITLADHTPALTATTRAA